MSERLMFAALLLGACSALDVGEETARARAAQPAVLASALSVEDATADAFSLPMPALSAAHLARFFVGNSFFNQNWIAAPSSLSARDGLGPLFNARSCSGCHFKDGRGRPPEANEPARSMIVRISVAGSAAETAHAVYGDQLQTDALPGLAPEVRVRVSYDAQPGNYPDGDGYTLRTPRLSFTEPGYGALGDVRGSARVAPALIGLGLLEAVPEAELLRREDPHDRDGDGISGRAQRLPSSDGAPPAIGRFGWKAEQASVRAQVAGAFQADMGITSELFPRENHGAQQPSAAARPSGGAPELSRAVLEDVVLYVRTLAIPEPRGAQDPELQAGRLLFERAVCSACHLPRLSTAEVRDLPELSKRALAPYSDLLLHDLGPALSDGRRVHDASGDEWRTAPLWGIGLLAKVSGHQLLLHDGRARGVAEAILFHGGEAERSKRAFMQLSRRERAQLVRFVESL